MPRLQFGRAFLLLESDRNYHPDDFLFRSDSMAWKINRHWTGLIYGPAAALLQIAHPRVAQGVAEHSDFREDALGRLQRTLEAVNRITFGTKGEAEAMARHIGKLHAKVQGEIAEGIEGRPKYSAFEPDLMLWVLGTLIEASLNGYETVFEKVNAAERDEFYRDFRIFGKYFGLDPAYGPQSYEEWWASYSLEKTRVGEHPICTEVASHVVYPRHRWLDRILGRLADFIAIEGLDPETRERLGLTSSWHTVLRWKWMKRFLRVTMPILPKRLTFYPESYEAEKRLGIL